jgi:hypothetical protein
MRAGLDSLSEMQSSSKEDSTPNNTNAVKFTHGSITGGALAVAVDSLGWDNGTRFKIKDGDRVLGDSK